MTEPPRDLLAIAGRIRDADAAGALLRCQKRGRRACVRQPFQPIGCQHVDQLTEREAAAIGG